MAPRLMVDAANNRAAIMINSVPENPFSDPSFTTPLSHVGNYKFHSALDYLGVVDTITGTVNLDIFSSGWAYPDPDFHTDSQRTIASHGQNFAPIIMGYVTIDGHNVPATGNAVIRGWANPSIDTFGWVALNFYCDQSKIYLLQSVLYGSLIARSKTISYTLYICNMGINSSGNLVRPPLNAAWDSTLTRVKSGRFDTKYGYFNKNSSGPLLIYRGKSTDVQVGGPVYVDGTYRAVGIVTNVNGYVDASIGTYQASVDGGHTFPGTNTGDNQTPKFTPSTVRVSASVPNSVRGWDGSSGRIRFGNVLNTDQNTFLITDFVSASATIPSKTVPSSSFVDSATIIDLGAVNSGATDVLGMYKIGGMWRSIGGTHVLKMSEARMYNGTQFAMYSGSNARLPALAVSFYFRISGGHLQIVVEYRGARDPNGSYTLFSSTGITVKAFCGTFDV